MKGTYEGDKFVEKFISEINNGNREILNNNFNNYKKIYAVKVNEFIHSKVLEKKVAAKSDVIICEGSINKEELKKLNYILELNHIKDFDLNIIPLSGISIKLKESKKYTYSKMGASIFKKLFKTNLLAAGASIYINEKEKRKNEKILKGWGISEKEFENFYENKIDDFNINDIRKLKKIKSLSNHLIKNQIKNTLYLQEFIFQGKHNFEDPFFASYLYNNKGFKIVNLNNYEFNVTTGSGRSKGNYTIVIKAAL